MAAGESEINAFIRCVKEAVNEGRLTLIPREKNLKALAKANLTIQDVKETLAFLTIKDYCAGPEPDHDPSREGEVWLFGCQTGGASWYIKIKLAGDEGKRWAICLSFHQVKHEMSFPYRDSQE